MIRLPSCELVLPVIVQIDRSRSRCPFSLEFDVNPIAFPSEEIWLGDVGDAERVVNGRALVEVKNCRISLREEVE